MVTRALRAIHIDPETYPFVDLETTLLNQARGPRFFGRTSFSMWAHIAGLSVSATMREKTTAKEIVTAN